MAWYPSATKMELQPESDTQPAIRPTQFIMHSIVAPWTPRRTYEYWQNSNLESHFGLGYDGTWRNTSAPRLERTPTPAPTGGRTVQAP